MEILKTKEELTEKIMATFKPSEIALINTNIYLNPEHIDYYQNFHSGEYDKCLEFLTENKHLLTIEHTPEEHKEIAKKLLESAKNFN